MFRKWIYSHLIRKAKDCAFTGHLIVDRKNGTPSMPQCKILRSIKGEFNLQQLFNLDSRLREIDHITFLPTTDNTLLFCNNSNCQLELNGVVVDNEKFHRLMRNDNLTIKTKNSKQSINVRITSLEEKSSYLLEYYKQQEKLTQPRHS